MKEKTKFLFFSVYRAALRLSFTQFCEALQALYPILNSKLLSLSHLLTSMEIDDGSKSLGDLKPILSKEDIVLQNYYSAPHELEFRGTQTQQTYQHNIGLLNESFQTLSDSRHFQYNLPKIPNSTANNSRVNVSLLSSCSEQQREDVKTLKKMHRNEKCRFIPGECGQTSQGMLFTEADSNLQQNTHEINEISKINCRSPNENDTFNDLLGNIQANGMGFLITERN